MIDQLTNIDEKIHKLKKRREKVQTQQAILFMREVQKILQDEFSPDLALEILVEAWTAATEAQKQKWRKKLDTFRASSLQGLQQKAQTLEPTPQQS